MSPLRARLTLALLAGVIAATLAGCSGSLTSAKPAAIVVPVTATSCSGLGIATRARLTVAGRRHTLAPGVLADVDGTAITATACADQLSQAGVSLAHRSSASAQGVVEVAMLELINAEWVQQAAEAAGVIAPRAPVRAEMKAEGALSPSGALSVAYFKRTHLSVAAVVHEAWIAVLDYRLEQRRLNSVPPQDRAASAIQKLQAFNRHYRALTVCRPGYAVWMCANGPPAV